MEILTQLMGLRLTSNTSVWIIWMVIVLITVAILPFAVRMEGVNKLLSMCFG